MPDLTPLWISIKVGFISTIIVSILGIFICRTLYKRKGMQLNFLKA